MLTQCITQSASVSCVTIEPENTKGILFFAVRSACQHHFLTYDVLKQRCDYVSSRCQCAVGSRRLTMEFTASMTAFWDWMTSSTTYNCEHSFFSHASKGCENGGTPISHVAIALLIACWPVLGYVLCTYFHTCMPGTDTTA